MKIMACFIALSGLVVGLGEEMFWFNVLAAATVIQITVNTIGPFGLFDKLRDRFPHDSVLGMFHCAWCMSVWASGLIMVIDVERSIVQWLAVAFLSGLCAWAIGTFQDLLGELVQLWRRS